MAVLKISVGSALVTGLPELDGILKSEEKCCMEMAQESFFFFLSFSQHKSCIKPQSGRKDVTVSRQKSLDRNELDALVCQLGFCS